MRSRRDETAESREVSTILINLALCSEPYVLQMVEQQPHESSSDTFSYFVVTDRSRREGHETEAMAWSKEEIATDLGALIEILFWIPEC